MTNLTALPAPAGLHLWLADLDAGQEVEDLALMGDAERSRAARFVFARDRRRYVAAQAALRRLLGLRTGWSPGSLRFRYGAFGKPSLSDTPNCAFNLSHSEHVGLIGISDSGELGVDVELVRHIPDAGALALAHFTATEQSELPGTGTADRDSRFLLGWTRKEACLKALGAGLSIRPETFEVGLTEQSRELGIQTDMGVVRVTVHSFRYGHTLWGAWAQTP